MEEVYLASNILQKFSLPFTSQNVKWSVHFKVLDFKIFKVRLTILRHCEVKS